MAATSNISSTTTAHSASRTTKFLSAPMTPSASMWNAPNCYTGTSHRLRTYHSRFPKTPNIAAAWRRFRRSARRRMTSENRSTRSSNSLRRRTNWRYGRSRTAGWWIGVASTRTNCGPRSASYVALPTRNGKRSRSCCTMAGSSRQKNRWNWIVASPISSFASVVCSGATAIPSPTVSPTSLRMWCRRPTAPKVAPENRLSSASSRAVRRTSSTSTGAT